MERICHAAFQHLNIFVRQRSLAFAEAASAEPGLSGPNAENIRTQCLYPFRDVGFCALANRGGRHDCCHTDDHPEHSQCRPKFVGEQTAHCVA